MKLNYDETYDVLYIVLKDTPAIVIERDGYLERVSMKTEKIVGLTIFDFKKKLKVKRR